MIKKEIILCVPVLYAVDHIVAPSPSKNTRKICIWICAWNNYVSYTLVCVHFIVCSMYVSSCSTPSFSSPSFSSPANSSPANSAIPYRCCLYAMLVNIRTRRSWTSAGCPMTGCTALVCHSTAPCLRRSWWTADCSTYSVRRISTNISAYTTSFTSPASYTPFSCSGWCALTYRWQVMAHIYYFMLLPELQILIN